MVIELTVLKVFLGPTGRGGNPLGVFATGPDVPRPQRQQVATDLGFSETVFVDDREQGSLQIYTPAAELPFAGHPLVGTAWWLTRTGSPVASLRPPAGQVPVRVDGDTAFVAGRPEWCPGFEHRQLASPAAVDESPQARAGLVAVWAWEDESAGRVRTRVFAPALGVAEDEATGAAALLLAALLERKLVISQGQGSMIEAAPYRDGLYEVGGRCALVEARPYRPPASTSERTG